MSTLTSPPVSTLLTRLFADAAATDTTLAQMRRQMTPDEQAAMHTQSNDYRTMYGRLKHAHLAVSAGTGKLLYLLARGCKARSIVEFGTSFGISTLHLAAALRDNGGGRLIGTEFEPSKIEHARQNLQQAGLADLVEIRAGDALESLSENLPAPVDLVLLDGAKQLYVPIFDLLAPQLRSGSLIVADNADWVPEYLVRVRADDGGYLSVPFADDVEVSIKL